MRTFRVKILFTSDSGTPLHSDTIFGHLCWVYRYENGEGALAKEILKDYDTNPSVIVSDGFPGDSFPYPCLPPVSEGLGTTLFIRPVDIFGISAGLDVDFLFPSFAMNIDFHVGVAFFFGNGFGDAKKKEVDSFEDPMLY